MEKDVLKHRSGIILINVKFLCTGCGKWIFGSKVGLRKMPDGWIRSQPRCVECRSVYHDKEAKREGKKHQLPKADILRHHGGKIILINSKFLCTGCNEWKWGSEVGLRKMRDGTIRSQPRCSVCRSKYHG